MIKNSIANICPQQFDLINIYVCWNFFAHPKKKYALKFGFVHFFFGTINSSFCIFFRGFLSFFSFVSIFLFSFFVFFYVFCLFQPLISFSRLRIKRRRRRDLGVLFFSDDV